MSKKDWKRKDQSLNEVKNIRNKPPTKQWQSFDQFWSMCVRNGSPLVKESLRMHLKALGWLEKPEKYLEGAIHFGIMVEK